MLRLRQLEPHCTNLLDEPFMELDLATEQISGRSPAFLFDPFICEALKAKGLYPPVPTSKEFAAKGLVLDSTELKTAIQTLLSRTDAPLTKQSLYAGAGNTACFSPALHQYLMANFESPLRQKIRCFLLHGQSQERSRAASRAQNSDSNNLHSNQPSGLNATAPSAESTAGYAALVSATTDAPFEPERSELHLQNAYQSSGAEMLAVMQEKMDRAFTERDHANKRFWRLEKRRQAPFRIPLLNGTLATPMKVDNIVFDPRDEQEPGQERKRQPTLCTEAIALIIHGSKEPRPNRPGWRWTLQSNLNEFLNWTRGGVEAAHRSPWLRELNLNDKVMSMWVVPRARSGYLQRRKLKTSLQTRNSSHKCNGYRLLDNPSAKTTHRQIIPTFLNLFGLWVVDVLRDSSTVRVGVSSDGCTAKSNGLLGTLISVYQRKLEYEDALGNRQYTTRFLRFPGPLTQTSNKLVKTLKDSRGGTFSPEAAFAMAKALYVGNFARWFLEYAYMFDLCLDCGNENKGLGPAEETADRMCGKNSIFDQLVGERCVWPDVIRQAEEWHVKGPTDGFFGNTGFQWEDEWSPEKLALASTTLNTASLVYKAREVVVMLSTYQRRESEQLVQKYRSVRPYAMRWLTGFRLRKEKRANSEEKVAKFRQVKPDKDPAAHRSEFRRRLSVRHTRAFKSSLLRMRYAKLVPSSAAPARPISMKRNPFGFFRVDAAGMASGLAS